jgi:Mce-associated membrane protein
VTNTEDGTPAEPSKATEVTEPAEAAEVSEPDEAKEVTEPDEATDAVESTDAAEPDGQRGTVNWGRVVGYGVLPALALILALVGGWLKFIDNTASDIATARSESVQAAKDGTVALLSYQPATVEQQLSDARKLLTGEFLNSYTSLTNEVVIPGAKQKQISAVANVPAAASVSADEEHAVVLLFINQTVVVGNDAPTATASSVRVTVDKIDGKWLISKFEPV